MSTKPVHEKVFVRAAWPFNYDSDEASWESGLVCTDESLAVQSDKDDADINTIVKRFGITGQLPQGVRVPTYTDYEGIFDFNSAMRAIRQAEESFAEMPADVRKRFNNDAAEFVAFCSDENNLDEMRKLGLAVPKAEDAPVPAVSETDKGGIPKS